MTETIERAKSLSGEGKTYADIAKLFNRESVQWDGAGRDWTRGDIENLMSHGSPEVTSDEFEPTAVDNVDTVLAGDATSEADGLANSESTPIEAANHPKSDADIVEKSPQAEAGSPSDLPKRKRHGRKWLLVAIAAIVGVLLGFGIAVPDRQAAKDEATKILADAKNDARDEADEIVDEARDEREGILEDAENENAELLVDIEAGKGELVDVKESIQTAKTSLASTERTRAQKQKLVDGLNRAIRASTSLSRENAVGTASSYLENQSFSCQGLIDQLEYEQYSNSDATYAAKQVGLC